MNSNSNSSLAVQAYTSQNLYEPSEKYPDARPSDTRFPGHDTFQNGVIENGKPTMLYTAATNEDIENIKNKKSNMSGFVTDGDTVNSCKDENGVLNANSLADKTQTAPWRDDRSPGGTDYTYRENVAALDVKWDELNKPENADLKARLCDSDGNIKCAFGKAEENYQWGNGGGNQYYFNKDDFNEAVNRGVFEYNEKETLKESDGRVTRRGISEDDYDVMNNYRANNVDKQLSSCQDKTATTSEEKAKSLNQITPEKERKINSDVAPKGNYIASPDPAYNYGRNASVSSENKSLPKTDSADKVANGGGARAPNGESGNSTAKPTERGTKPSQNDNPPSDKSASSERGHKPSPADNEPHPKSAERGSKPTENENNVQGSNPAVRGEKPQETSRGVPDAPQTQRGTLPGQTGGEDLKVPSSSSSNPTDKTSANTNFTKSADDAPKAASDNAAQNVVPKTNGMGM